MNVNASQEKAGFFSFLEIQKNTIPSAEIKFEFKKKNYESLNEWGFLKIQIIL